MRILNTVQAVNEAHHLLLAESPNNIIIGEGVGDAKNCFQTTTGLKEKFPSQVFDSPVSENGVVGVCIGASLGGIRPIHMHMRPDFLLYAMDQIVNSAAKWSSMYGGNGGNVPIVIKAFNGRGWGAGHQHSQNLESLFAHIPGLKVLIPSSPRTAKGLLIAAAHDPNPCIILEDRWIHHLEGDVPEGIYETPIDYPEVVREGKDATIICWGQLVSQAVLASRHLATEGFGLEVIDLQTLSGECLIELSGLLISRDNIYIAQNAWDIGAFAHTASRFFPNSKTMTLRHCYPSSTPALTKDYYLTAAAIVERLGYYMPPVEPHDIPDKSFTGPF